MPNKPHHNSPPDANAAGHLLSVKLCGVCAPLVQRFTKLRDIRRGLCSACKSRLLLARAKRLLIKNRVLRQGGRLGG